MSTSAALEPDFTDPAILAAHAICAFLDQARPIVRPALLGVREDAYGSTAVNDGGSLHDAYDVLVDGQDKYLVRAPLPFGSIAALARLADLAGAMPTYTVRSENQIDLQQFSTPAPVAFLAARPLHLTKGDLVLEPSAETGLLAIFAHRLGASLILNKSDPRRNLLLGASFPDAKVTRHDAELIDDLLPPKSDPLPSSSTRSFREASVAASTARRACATCARPSHA